MRDSGALTELLLTRLKNVEVPIARWLILHKPLAEGNVVFPQIIKIATPETARCGGPYDCTPSGEPFEVVGILWWSISRSGLNTRQLTFFSSTAFLTALSRAERTDRPVLTSMKTISISSEPLSPLNAIRSMGVPRKRMSLGSRSKPGRYGTMCSVTFPLVTAELRWMASSLISCSCCCFHRSIWMRTSALAKSLN